MAVSTEAIKAGREAVVVVCHHCGRLLSADEAKRLSHDPHFSGVTEALHCAACYHEPAAPRRGWRWLARPLLRWIAWLALLLVAGCFTAALIQVNAFGLGTLWHQWWPLLDRYWEPVEPTLGPWLGVLRPVVDLISGLLAGFLGGGG